MLLPSALSCDSSQPRGLQSALFISPPTSPHHHQLSAQSAIGNLINSCRNLHNLIAPSTPERARSHLPSPPLANVPSPMRPRLRRREAKATATSSHLNQAEAPRYRIKKRAPPPRGLNKRRRDVDDDEGRDDDDEEDDMSDDENQQLQPQQNFDLVGSDRQQSADNGVFVFKGADAYNNTQAAPRAAPSTPKRQRIAPPEVPMGLTREDFHKIAPLPILEQDMTVVGANNNNNMTGRGQGAQNGDNKWSFEDDHKLVEIVLEKVKNMDLSKEVWQDCVRNLPGRDYNSVSLRWKSLISRDKIGLQDRRTRGKLHGTW